MAISTPIEIFCFYAHEDEVWRQKLEAHLSLLKQQGFISLWHDRLITAGTEWAHVINQHIETAAVILLLVSVDFLASDYYMGVEMKRALERQETGEALIIPILVRPVTWKGASFAHLHVLPTNAKPLTSWPDEDIALADVAEGIRRAIENMTDLSAKALHRALPPIWNIPYRRNIFFTGREDLLARVHAHLQSGQSMAISQHPQALSGLGGIGKTQFAVEYAYRFSYEYKAVLWVHAESRETFDASYASLAALLDLPVQSNQKQEIVVQVVKHWLQTHTGWLLILDNVDELSLAQEYLPPTLGGHLLLTTRARAMRGLAKRIDVEVFSAEQGALFLLRRAGLLAHDALLEQARLEDQEYALHITQDLGGLPLALDQAGAYLEETEESLLQYQQLYEQHRINLLQERRGLGTDHPDSVGTTWSISFQRIEEKNPAAADLLLFCAFLSPDTIFEEILTESAAELGPALGPVAADALRFNQAIEMILAYSLMQRDPQKKTLSMHRLVQSVILHQMKDEKRQSWAQRAILAVDTVFPESEPTNWWVCELLLPQALFVTQLIEMYQINLKNARSLLSKVAQYLRDRLRYQEAERFYKYALHIYEQQLGTNSLETTVFLEHLGFLHIEQDKFEEAELLYQRALHIREQQLGPNHLDVANILNGLGILYRKSNRFKEAALFYQRALHIYEQQLGSGNFALWPMLNNMAILNTYQGKYPEAEAFYQRALSIYEQEKEIDHPGVVLLLLSLTALYIQQGRFATAERFYQRVLDRSKIWEQELGDTHYRVALWLNITADLYTKQGEYIKAETLYLCAINFWGLWEQQLGDKFPDKVETFSGLASLYFRQGKHEQGEKLFEQALSLNLNPASVYKKRAYMFLHIKNRIYSIQDFNTSIELLPEDVEAAWMVIWILFDKQLPKSEVAEQLEKIALLDPKSSEAYICRGVALGLRGKHQEGLVELEHALQLDVVDEDAWFWKGMICTRLGDDTTAIAAIAQALQYGLPPILLTPLFWLEQERPQFYQEFAEPLLKQHGLL